MIDNDIFQCFFELMDSSDDNDNDDDAHKKMDTIDRYTRINQSPYKHKTIQRIKKKIQWIIMWNAEKKIEKERAKKKIRMTRLTYTHTHTQVRMLAV